MRSQQLPSKVSSQIFLLCREVPSGQSSNRTNVDHVERNTHCDTLDVFRGKAGRIFPSRNALDEAKILVDVEDQNANAAIADVIDPAWNGGVQQIAWRDVSAFLSPQAGGNWVKQ